MLNINPTIAKLFAAALAIAAYVASAYVTEPAAQTALYSLAGALIGWQFAPRAGDVALKGVNVDDL